MFALEALEGMVERETVPAAWLARAAAHATHDADGSRLLWLERRALVPSAPMTGPPLRWECCCWEKLYASPYAAFASSAEKTPHGRRTCRLFWRLRRCVPSSAAHICALLLLRKRGQVVNVEAELRWAPAHLEF